MNPPETPPAPTTPKRRSRWRWPMRAVLALVLLFVGAVIVYAVEWKLTRRAGQKKLDAATARLDAEDPGWRFEEIVADHNAKVPPPESNSALRAVEIAKAFPPRSDLQTSLDTVYTKVAEGRLPNELPPQADWDELESQYGGYEKGIAELRKWDAGTPRGRLSMDLNRFDGRDPLDLRHGDSFTFLTTSFALWWDSVRWAHKGNPGKALGAAAANLHLIRSVDFEPMITAQLIRLGRPDAAVKSVEQTLAWCRSADDTTLKEMQELMGREATRVPVLPTFRGERAYAMRRLELFDRGEHRLVDRPLTTSERLLMVHLRQFVPDNAALVDERIVSLAATVALAPGQRAATLKEWKSRPSNGRTFPFNLPTNLAATVMPPADRLVLAGLRHDARCLCAEAGIACERFRLKHGCWPKSLDDLQAFGIPKGPVDPFDGEPLRYRIEEDGVCIYSVGENGIDDGGDTHRREGKPEDTGFRLWNPAKRRVPITEVPPDEAPPPNP